jgi:dTDP-glucose pyrophosphorylase
MNIVIPMAGEGSRFKSAGYTFPKPLIEVGHGVPMIQAVVNNLTYPYANYIFLVRAEHEKKYHIKEMLKRIIPINTTMQVVLVNGLTAGAACTTLLAKPHLVEKQPLVIANTDQLVEWRGLAYFIEEMEEENADGGMLTFQSVHPKWSYARLDSKGRVVEVAEKRPISTNATAGIYYWKRAWDYIKYAQQMIEKNLTVNGEFYVCPVFNEAISDGKIIRTSEAAKMWGLGTPEDLQYFQRNTNL